MDFEWRPGLKWCSFFRRIAMMENEAHRSSAVLDRWEEEERCLSKWELCRVAKELRKFRHFRLTLDKDPIAMNEGSKMVVKMATMRIKLLRNKREAQIEYQMRDSGKGCEWEAEAASYIKSFWRMLKEMIKYFKGDVLKANMMSSRQSSWRKELCWKLNTRSYMNHSTPSVMRL